LPPIVNLSVYIGSVIFFEPGPARRATWVAWSSWSVSQVAYWAEGPMAAVDQAEIMPIAARHDWSFAGPPLLPSGELAQLPAGARASRRPERPRAGPADLDGPGGTGSNGKQN
jgi:hypothetical protein